MRLSYKYSLDLSKAQIKQLSETFGFLRNLYNCALEQRIIYFKTYKKSLSHNTQRAELPLVKELFPAESKLIHSQSFQHTLERLDNAYKNFFRRIKNGETPGFPRFKNKDRFRSICFPQANLSTGGVKLLENKRLIIRGIPGEVKVKWHRPFEGRCKQIYIVKQSDKFYIILSCDDVPNKILPKTNRTVAIDLGIATFATANDGTKFRHPKPYKTAKEKLAILNKKLADKQKGSNNRNKTKRSLVKLYDKTVNIRDDFQHKLANKLISKYDVLIVEDLNIKGMIEAKGFEVNKSNITDASWGSFLSKLTYKAERAGKSIIRVNPKNTSKTCSKCLNICSELKLKERRYHCESCGFTMDRDFNAARNIYRFGKSRAVS